MTLSPYKQFSLTLKNHYNAKVQMLSMYQTMLRVYSLNTITRSDINLTPKQIERYNTIDKINKKEIEENILNVKRDLRIIHLFRAFIKDVPYLSVEPSCEIPVSNIQHLIGYSPIIDKLLKIYNIKDVKTYVNIVDIEFPNWYTTGYSSKFFAKPQKETVVYASIESNTDANGSVVQ